MQVSITFRHMEASTALRDHVDSKIGHLEKYLIKPTEVRVVLSVEKFRHRTEVIVVAQNFKATADETTDDMYKSIDKALMKVEKQLKRHKGKIQEHHKHHLQDIAVHAEHEYALHQMQVQRKAS